MHKIIEERSADYTTYQLEFFFCFYHHNAVRILCWPLAKLPPAPSGFPPGQSVLFCQNVRIFIRRQSQKPPKMSGFLIWGPLLVSQVLRECGEQKPMLQSPWEPPPKLDIQFTSERRRPVGTAQGFLYRLENILRATRHIPSRQRRAAHLPMSHHPIRQHSSWLHPISCNNSIVSTGPHPGSMINSVTSFMGKNISRT